MREASKSHRINNRLDKQANRSDATVVDENLKTVFNACNCLIANRNHVCKIQTTLLQRQIQPNIATLTDDRRPKRFGFTTMLIGPQCNAVESIDIAITVWSEQRHFTGCCNKLLL